MFQQIVQIFAMMKCWTLYRVYRTVRDQANVELEKHLTPVEHMNNFVAKRLGGVRKIMLSLWRKNKHLRQQKIHTNFFYRILNFIPFER